MSSVLYGLGRAAYRKRWLVLIIWLVVLLAVGGAAAGFSKSFEDDFRLPGTESQQGLDMLNNTFPAAVGASAQVVVVAPDGQSVTDDAVRTVIDHLIGDLEDLPQVEAVASPYEDPLGEPLTAEESDSISANEQAALVTVQMDADLADITDETREEITALAAGVADELSGAEASAGGEIYQEVAIGLSIIDAIGVVVALIVLWITLGSLRAAGLPLLTALWGVGISCLAIVLGTAFIVMNSTTIMLALMLGLAVGIDYALFILSRHRDQLGTGIDPEESAARAVATSGSAVVFAGLTVMIALAGLAVAGIPFLATMGFAAAAAVGIAVLVAITALPALMGVMGRRLQPRAKKSDTVRAELANGVAQGEPAKSNQDGKPAKPKKSWAERWVGAATKIPALTVVIVVVALSALAIPATGLKLALPDAGDNPAGSPTRVTYDLISEHFGPGHNGPLIVTADIVASDDPLGVIDGIVDRIEQVPGVAAVPLATPNESIDTAIVQVVPTTAPDDEATVELVHRLRDLQAEFEQDYDVTTLVTGVTAVQIDVSEQLGQALVPFAILVVGLSLILLMIVFRSIWVPIKAAVGYLFSVLAAFGVVALVFEHGVGASVLGLDQTGPVISFLPIILMGILFGLAMDYEVFLVSRIREDHVHGTPAREAVKTGFVASARVVLAAGLIMFAVFAAFVPEGDAILKSIALGLAVGIFVDAFVIRMTLVPAVLQLLGEKAWWIPKWLDRILPSFDVEGEGLQHRLSLAEWPRAGEPYAVAAEDLTVAGVPVLGPGGLFVEPGQAIALTGGEARHRSAALLALTGRTPVTGGRAKITDLVLPQQAGPVRRRTLYVDAADTTPADIADQVDNRTGTPLLVVAIDHADQLSEAQRTELGALTERLCSTGTAVVVSAAQSMPGLPGAPAITEREHGPSGRLQPAGLV